MTVGQKCGEHVDDGLALELERVPEVALGRRRDVAPTNWFGNERLVETPARAGRGEHLCEMCGLRGSARSGEPGISRNRTKLKSTIRTIVTIAWPSLRPK